MVEQFLNRVGVLHKSSKMKEAQNTFRNVEKDCSGVKKHTICFKGRILDFFKVVKELALRMEFIHHPETTVITQSQKKVRKNQSIISTTCDNCRFLVIYGFHTEKDIKHFLIYFKTCYRVYDVTQLAYWMIKEYILNSQRESGISICLKIGDLRSTIKIRQFLFRNLIDKSVKLFGEFRQD